MLFNYRKAKKCFTLNPVPNPILETLHSGLGDWEIVKMQLKHSRQYRRRVGLAEELGGARSNSDDEMEDDS